MSSPAKLTPPRLGDTHPRQRLFARLDAARVRSATWITGPPGAGKTTLVASYLQARRLSALWYQLDAGDNDPATLFYFLRQVARGRRGAPLPLLGPEYMADLDGFARRFFRALFERLRHPFAVVFDNFHEVAAGGPLHAIVRTAIAEAPVGVDLFVISREAPSAVFARLSAHRLLVTLGWEDLRLDADEAAAIVALHRPEAVAQSARLHRHAGGWAAGMVLLLRATAATIGEIGPENAPEVGLTPELLFDYLASEVFDHAPVALRKLWLRTAQLSNFTAPIAVQLSGNAHAGALLDKLWRRRYFIDKSPGAEATYQYHALFRKFLRDKLQRNRGPLARRRQAGRAAALLEQHGDREAALSLYREAEDWTAASRLILGDAKSLFGVGRIRTLEAWIGMLPPTLAGQDAWLLYWRGCCAAHSGATTAARRDLTAAFERQAEVGDTAGQCLAAAAMIESYFLEWNEFSGVDRWTEALRRLLVEQPQSLADPALELKIRAALLLALAYRAPQDALAAASAERVLQLCRADIGPAEKLAGATALVQYLGQMESVSKMAQVVAEFAPLADSPSTTPMQQILWHWSSAMLLLLDAEPAAMAEIFRKTRELCTDNGLGYILNFMRLFAVWGVLVEGRSEAAHRELDAIGLGLDGLRPNDVALYHFLRAWLALLEHRPREALECAEIAAGMTPGLGSAGPIICSFGVCSQALIASGDAERALAAARVPKALVPAAGSGSFRFSVLLFEADALRHLGRLDEFRAVLRDALATGRSSDLLSPVVWLPEMVSRLCAEALDAEIEVEYVERLIRTRGLLPPGPEAEHWPRPLRIYTLGRFSIVVDGVALEFKGKAQKRPLELLKALLAQGGRGVDHGELLQQLWPDLDGDAARNAFDLALHRLRKLLLHPEVLGLEDGRLRLDARRVWVDAWALERLCGQIDRAPSAIQSTFEHQAHALLRLYHGPLLAGEDAAWALAARQRLRNKFERSLCHLADELQRDEAGEQAVELYRRGVEIEPQSAVLQRGLIAACRRQGRFSEAAAAYRQFRDLLALTLGIEPGLDIQALYRGLPPS